METKKSIYIRQITVFLFITFIVMDLFADETSKHNGNLKLISQNVYVELFEDGSYISTGENKSINISDQSISEYYFMSSTNSIDKVLDNENNEIIFTVTREPNIYKYTVKLNKVIFPGKEVIIKTISKRTEAGIYNNSNRVYQKRHIPGPAIKYSETIKLPSNTELLSVVPEPSNKYIEDNTTVLEFNQQLSAGQAFYCKILYELINIISVNTNNQNITTSEISATDKYFYEIKLNDVACGYGEINISEKEIDGQEVLILDQYNIIRFIMMEKTITSKQKLIYYINPETGNFVYHSSYNEQAGTKNSMEIFTEGNNIKLKSPDISKPLSADLTDDVFLLNTFFYNFLVKDFVNTFKQD